MDFDVLCPCCNARLKVDAELKAVVAHEAPKTPRKFASVDDALGALKGQDEEREKKFAASIEAEIPALVAARMIPSIHSPERIAHFAREASLAGVRLPVHLFVDTGMSRLGVNAERALEHLRAIADEPIATTPVTEGRSRQSVATSASRVPR